MQISGRFISNTYYVQKNIYIDVVSDLFLNTYDAYMYHDDFGVKFHMFGVDQEYKSFEAFVELVEANIDDYLDILEDKINELCN